MTWPLCSSGTHRQPCARAPPGPRCYPRPGAADALGSIRSRREQRSKAGASSPSGSGRGTCPVGCRGAARQPDRHPEPQCAVRGVRARRCAVVPSRTQRTPPVPRGSSRRQGPDWRRADHAVRVIPTYTGTPMANSAAPPPSMNGWTPVPGGCTWWTLLMVSLSVGGEAIVSSRGVVPVSGACGDPARVPSRAILPPKIRLPSGRTFLSRPKPARLRAGRPGRRRAAPSPPRFRRALQGPAQWR